MTRPVAEQPRSAASIAAVWVWPIALTDIRNSIYTNSVSIVSFEHDMLGSASAELEALGVELATEMLLHCQEVDSKRIDYRRLKVFSAYSGVEMFLATIGDALMVFSVESDESGDLKITIMFAGRHGISAASGAHIWNGNDYAALRTGVVHARAVAWFD